ncbi:MAG: hypothetical protein QG578_1834 [Thermodesulfobacteriota bacterium]|nr:hypothetical protein [Thermodesulfobacteriota bacterium]
MNKTKDSRIQGFGGKSIGNQISETMWDKGKPENRET